MYGPRPMISAVCVLAMASCPAVAEEPIAAPVAAAVADLWTRPGEDWPGFLGPSGNGTSSLDGLVVPWPDGGPRVVWHRELGEGYCSPAVALGRCVICDRVGREVRVRCLAAETGEELWQAGHATDYVDTFGYDGGPRATAVIAGDAVLTFGPDGRLVCRSLADGRQRWEVDTSADYHVVQNFFGVGTAPLVIDSPEGPVVVVQVGGSRPGSAPPSPERLDLVKGLDSGLVAFDLASGRERWRSSGELASYSTPLLARIAGKDHLLAWMRDSFLVVDPRTGDVRASHRWRADELVSVVAASPVVSGDEILLSETYGPGSVLLKFDGDGLEELRRDPATARRPTRGLRAHWATPILHEGHVYGSSGRNAGDAVLVCAEWKSGAIRWSVPGLGRASLALADGQLVIRGEFGDLVLAEATPEAYREVSRTRLVDPLAAPGRPTELLAAPCWAAPVIAHGYLFVRGQGRLVCVDLLPR
ncbi:MAG: PQQ-binding-like beta-propeller repeat protein [Planctomycetia bacterium]